MWLSHNGRRWHEVRLPGNARNVRGDLISVRTAHVLDQAGRFWTTTDRGHTWKRGASTGPFVPRALSFSDRRHGFAFVPGTPSVYGWRTPGSLANVLRTDDGGRTWRPQAFQSLELRDVLSIDGLDAVAVASDSDSRGSQLVGTRTRGDAGRRAKLTLRASPMRTHLRPGARIAVSGRLTPARGGEQILISATTDDPRRHADCVLARAGNDGTFAVRMPIVTTSHIVAYYIGDRDKSSAGSRPIRIVAPGPVSTQELSTC
jgi:hypothetical protein